MKVVPLGSSGTMKGMFYCIVEDLSRGLSAVWMLLLKVGYGQLKASKVSILFRLFFQVKTVI